MATIHTRQAGSVWVAYTQPSYSYETVELEVGQTEAEAVGTLFLRSKFFSHVNDDEKERKEKVAAAKELAIRSAKAAKEKSELEGDSAASEECVSVGGFAPPAEVPF